jgi:hypothetical protein
MYQFLDRKLDELGAPDAFLIGAMRMWVSWVQAGRCPCRMTSTHFTRAGLENIAGDFSMAMFTLNGDGLQQLHFAHPGCPKVRDDEARLLALFKGGVDGDQPALEKLAALLVDAAAVPRLTQAVSIVAGQVAASPVFTRHD